MGMFDHVIVEDINILPISDSEKELLHECEFQTKDFENILTEVYITKDGRLKICDFELESVPPEERPYPNAEGIMGVFGSIRRVNERLRDLNFHGIMKFYTFISKPEKQWFDFRAKFTDGNLVEVSLIVDKDDNTEENEKAGE